MSESDESGLDVDRLEAGLGDFLARNDKWMGCSTSSTRKFQLSAWIRGSRPYRCGLRVVHNPVMDLSVLSGIAFQRKTPTGEARRDTEDRTTCHSGLGAWYPRCETKLSAIAIFYHSFTDADRRRFDSRMNLDHEVFSNFTIGLHYLYNFDSDPLNAVGGKR